MHERTDSPPPMYMEPAFTDLGGTDAILYDRTTFFGLISASSLPWQLDILGLDPGEQRWGRSVTDSAYVTIAIQMSWDE